MDETNSKDLEKVRLDRAEELLTEAKELFQKDSLKSANNRAFYAMEKALKALLAEASTDASTHSGVIKLFNYHYIHLGDGTFSQKDYQKVISSDQIRSASDYDDFYIASRSATKSQIDDTEYMIRKIKDYLDL